MKDTQRLRGSAHLIIAVVLVPLYLMGCSTPPPSPSATTTSVTFAPSPNATLPLATYTPLPSPVPPTTTPLPTQASPSPTFTPYPTLTAEERYAFVREMLKTNAGCELPCWWGVVPGETDWHTVLNRFRAVGFAFDIPHPTRPYDYLLDLSFDHQNSVVQSIQVTSYISPGDKSERFAQDWHRYSLDQVLTRYGEPSQVMLELWPNPPEPYYPYRLFVFYEERGILIAYEGPAIPGETLQVCPKFEQVTHLRLWLQSPGQERSLLELADLDPLEQAQMLPLEEATGMDVQTFYETFRQAGTTTCLESPAEVWPQH